MTAPYHGHFCWYELLTDDVAAAERFYGDVLGWTARRAETPGVDYHLFARDGQDAAGFMAMPERMREGGGRPVWLAYLAVEDVDAQVRAAEAEGAAIHVPPMTIPGVGSMAMIADPQGAAICLLQPDAPRSPAEGGGAAATAGWHELATGDLDGAMAFYGKHFGWSHSRSFPMGEMGNYEIFAIAGTELVGMVRKREAVPVSVWLVYLKVPAIDAAKDAVEKAGGTVLNGPMEVPGGSWVVQACDPQGAMFALVAPER